ncbi:hypothetical protein BUALT_Bualt08G0034500 [Buddleja alternifolia]|uniref:DUF4378 domain-containing protein n=1 Tax=Buddleja alternifolia TaxID=168488 RepID=A0AAV6XAM5_9LAMI|nr:hypothetical protein BUALT_Bualt08G0034500 [Buddleja alternifolia]
MPKLLSEYLQEQQQPFALDLYLVERGYSNTPTTPNATSTFCNLFKCSSSRRGLINKRRYLVPNCSKFVKSVFSRLVFDNQKINNNIPVKNDNKKCGDEDEDEDEDEEDKYLSSGSSSSSTTVFDSCSENIDCLEAVDILLTSPEKEGGDADRKLEWRSGIEDDDCKQLSPVSVLQHTQSRQEEHNLKRRKVEPLTSTCRCKIKQATDCSVEELHELQVGSNSNSHADDQYIINKRALQQTKQLLIDCLREVIENHRKRDKNRQELKKILGTEELWKLVCENVWVWSQDSIDETNIHHLLHHDYLASAEEWSTDFELRKEVISMEIGDAILEDIINEILTVF